jgi:hypothetical protein
MLGINEELELPSLRAIARSRGNPVLKESKIDCRVGSKEPPRNDEELQLPSLRASVNERGNP